MKLSHSVLIAFSGFVWLVIGTFLLTLGINFLMNSVGDAAPAVSFMASYVGGAEQAAILFLALGLYIGHLKGRKVLSKSVFRIVNRLQTFPNPTSFKNLYPVGYYFLIGGMVFLGMGIKYLGIPLDIRGTIDIAIGSALINGSVLYFKQAWLLRKVVTI